MAALLSSFFKQVGEGEIIVALFVELAIEHSFFNRWT